MPSNAPNIKVNAVKTFGKEFAEIVLIGDTFDDSFKSAKEYANKNDSVFCHAFEDLDVIEG